jgi:hypothetical protein
MTKPAVTLRNTKGSALNYSELDTNFTNLRNATINFTDGTNTLSMDLNDTVTVAGQSTHNMSVTVNEAGNVITVDNKLSEYTQEPMGFENRTDSVFSFDAATRTFSISPVSTSYRVWTQGTMRVKTTTETKQIPNISDLYYFYFDTAGALQYTNILSFETDCAIASVQWNAADSQYYFLGEERHGIVMDWATHEYLNNTRGFQYASGLLAINYTTSGTGSNNADAQIDIDNGVLYQEDIKISVTHSNSPTYSNFEQDLQGPGRFPVMYHNGSTGQWKKDSATDYPVKQGTARIAYNLNTAGVWTTPDAGNNNYVAMWLVATGNVKDGPIIALLGQRQDNSISNAQVNNTWNSLDLTNFPGNETRPLYRLIFKTGTGYANTPKCHLADILDYRTTDVRGSESGGGSGASGITAIVDDTSPQLGGDLDVNGFDITAATNQPITIAGVGSGSIFLTPDTGYVYLDGLRWPAADGSANQVLKTDGVGNLSWTTIGTINSGTTNNIAYYSGSNTIDDSTVLSLTNPTGASTPDLKFSGAAYFSVAAGSEMLIRGGVSQSTQIAVGLTALTMTAGDTNNAIKGKIEIDGANILIKPVTIGSNNGPLNIFTNSIVLGETSENATITTNGSGDLILNTAAGTNSGNITIADGANQNITITPNGTGKTSITNPDFTGSILVSGKQAVNGPAFSAYATNTLQTITSGSQQKVLFQTEEFDTNNNYASSTFTPTVEGYYQLNSSVRIDGSTGTGEIMIVIWKNGSEYKRGTNQQGTQIAADFWEMNVSSVVYANGTSDYFEVYVQQTSGASRTVTAVASPNITYFNGCMIRGA